MLFIQYPPCSTCQKAKKWLDGRETVYEERNIKTENPTVEELDIWQRRSGLELKRFFNTSGLKYKELELKNKLSAMSRQEQLQLLASDGMLVKRPLLITEDRVLVGFREAQWEESL